MVCVCVRGRDLLGGAQRIDGVVPTDVDDLVHILRDRLRHKKKGVQVSIDHLRYYSPELGEWVLLRETSELEGLGSRVVLEIGSQRSDDDVFTRLSYIVLAFSQLAKSVWKDPSVVRTMESFSPTQNPQDCLPAADASAVSNALSRLQSTLSDKQEDLLVAYLIDALRDMADPSPAVGGAAAEERRPVGLTEVLSSHDPEDAAALCSPQRQVAAEAVAARRPATAEVASEAVAQEGSPARPATAAAAAAGAAVRSPRTVYATTRDSTRQKVVLVDVLCEDSFELLRAQFEAKFKLPARSAQFQYVDDEGFHWEIGDTASLREFLARVHDSKKAELVCIPPIVLKTTAPRRPRDASGAVVARGKKGLSAEGGGGGGGGGGGTDGSGNGAGVSNPDDDFFEKREGYLRAKWAQYLREYDADASGTLSADEICALLRKEGTYAWLDGDGVRAPGQPSFLAAEVSRILEQVCVLFDVTEKLWRCRDAPSLLLLPSPLFAVRQEPRRTNLFRRILSSHAQTIPAVTSSFADGPMLMRSPNIRSLLSNRGRQLRLTTSSSLFFTLPFKE